MYASSLRGKPGLRLGTKIAVMITADLLRFGTEALTAVLLLEGTAHVWQLAVLQ